jgi:hypothetical protein
MLYKCYFTVIHVDCPGFYPLYAYGNIFDWSVSISCVNNFILAECIPFLPFLPAYVTENTTISGASPRGVPPLEPPLGPADKRGLTATAVGRMINYAFSSLFPPGLAHQPGRLFSCR